MPLGSRVVDLQGLKVLGRNLSASRAGKPRSHSQERATQKTS